MAESQAWPWPGAARLPACPQPTLGLSRTALPHPLPSPIQHGASLVPGGFSQHKGGTVRVQWNRCCLLGAPRVGTKCAALKLPCCVDALHPIGLCCPPPKLLYLNQYCLLTIFKHGAVTSWCTAKGLQVCRRSLREGRILFRAIVGCEPPAGNAICPVNCRYN